MELMVVMQERAQGVFSLAELHGFRIGTSVEYLSPKPLENEEKVQKEMALLWSIEWGTPTAIGR